MKKIVVIDRCALYCPHCRAKYTTGMVLCDGNAHHGKVIYGKSISRETKGGNKFPDDCPLPNTEDEDG
jgi:hypothetical protein